MKTSDQTDKIYKAIFAVKKELTSVAKSSDNPFFKSKYADLNSHLEVAEPLLEKNGCMVLQPVNSDNTVETRIVHVESQQFVSSEMPLVLTKNTMQDAGSAVTYARRYTLGALLSMKAEDDDGNVASGRVANSKAAAPTVAKPESAAASKTGLASANAATVTVTAEAKKSSAFRNNNKTTTPKAAAVATANAAADGDWT
jgi:hypothetical protein